MTSFWRIIKYAFQHFIRNFGLSVVSIIILLLTLVSANVFIAFNYITDEVINMVHEKVDVSLYFKKDVTAKQLDYVYDYLKDLKYVKDVKRLSAEDVLENFKKTHADNEEMLKSLDEVGENPFGPMFIIKVNSIDSYNYLIQALDTDEFNNLLERRSYDNHENALEHLKAIGEKVKVSILAFTLIFLLISMIIVYNTVKVMIYNHREEIHIMKLVGASNYFIKWPFLIEGMITVTIAMFLTLLLVYPFLLRAIEIYIRSFDLSLVKYFTDNFVNIFLSEYLLALLLTLFSSSLAVGKHLRK